VQVEADAVHGSKRAVELRQVPNFKKSQNYPAAD
jgi:hypothetical protein